MCAERTIRISLRAALVLLFATHVSATEVEVRTVDSKSVTGQLVSFSLDRGLVLEAPSGTRRIGIQDIIRVAPVSNRRIHRSETGPTRGSSFSVTLAGPAPADRLVGLPGVFENERIALHVPSLGTVPIPLEHMAVWRNLRLGGDARVSAMLAAPSDGQDRLLVANGDRLDGVIVVVDSAGFVLETDGGEVRIAHDHVVAASIVGVPLERRGGPHARVTLADGTRVTCSALGWSKRGAVLKVFDGVEHRAAEDAVASVDIVGGRWQCLTELAPTRVEETPMISVAWPFQVDRSVTGRPLRVGGESFDRGIGVHARSSLTFDLAGQYREFVTSYGMDDDSGPLADVAISILVDGVTKHERASLGRGTLVGPVRIDVSGAKRIELLVDFGRMGGIQDRFDWLEPAIIR